MDFRELVAIGLQENEAKLYLEGIKLGPSLASTLNRRVGFSRGNTYFLLNSMIRKGYFSKFEKNGTTYFVAEPPAKIMALLDFREKEIHAKKRRLQELMSSLEALGNTQGISRPVVRYFEGEKAVQQIYEEGLLHPNYSFWNPKAVAPHFSAEFFQTLFEGKWGRQEQWEIIPDSEFNRNFIAKRSVKNIRTKFFPGKETSFSTDNFIYGDKFGSISFSEERIFGIVVEGKEFAETQRAMFLNLWSQL